MTISAGGGMNDDEGGGGYGGALTLRGGFANGRARINKGSNSVLRSGWAATWQVEYGYGRCLLPGFLISWQCFCSLLQKLYGQSRWRCVRVAWLFA